MDLFAKKLISLFCIIILLGGCCSTTLHRSADWPSVVRPQFAVLAIGKLSDKVACDDEAYFLQEYLEHHNLFYDVVLADPDHPERYHDADVLVSGKIKSVIDRPHTSVLGVFATIFTAGLYALFGGPLRIQKMDTYYNFEVVYSDSAVTRDYHFHDSRKVYYGIYKPPGKDKPELYQVGWETLVYQICKELMAQREFVR